MDPRVCLAHQSETALGPGKQDPRNRDKVFQGSNSWACNGPESKREGHALVFRTQGHTTGSWILSLTTTTVRNAQNLNSLPGNSAIIAVAPNHRSGGKWKKNLPENSRWNELLVVEYYLPSQHWEGTWSKKVTCEQSKLQLNSPNEIDHFHPP